MFFKKKNHSIVFGLVVLTTGTTQPSRWTWRIGRWGRTRGWDWGRWSTGWERRGWAWWRRRTGRAWRWPEWSARGRTAARGGETAEQSTITWLRSALSSRRRRQKGMQKCWNWRRRTLWLTPQKFLWDWSASFLRSVNSVIKLLYLCVFSVHLKYSNYDK